MTIFVLQKFIVLIQHMKNFHLNLVGTLVTFLSIAHKIELGSQN
jgi:hypothetical protein